MALLMVTGAGARGAVAVRLVQGFGTTDAPAEAVAPSPPLPAPAAAAGEVPGRRRGPMPDATGKEMVALRGACVCPPGSRTDGCTAEA